MRRISINKSNLSRKMKDNSIIRESIEKRKVTDAVRSVFVEIYSYEDLVKEIAELSYLNQDYLLFFRGQNVNYQYGKLSTIYPSIYRGSKITKEELQYRFQLLDAASNMLKYKLSENSNKHIIGLKEILKIDKIQWSILQHYGVCDTPYLDLTHSLRVACSFAQQSCTQEFCYVYVLAMPYLSGRISINSEHDLTNIRLLSISPPQALRPYFQEGYLAGTEYTLADYDDKSELDFNRRLIGIYQIPNTKEFWGSNFGRYDEKLLFPTNDEMQRICEGIKDTVHQKLMNNEDIGSFLMNWEQLESLVKLLSNNKNSLSSSLEYLGYNNIIDKEYANQIRQLSLFRNNLINNPSSISDNEINQKISLLNQLNVQINQQIKNKSNNK